MDQEIRTAILEQLSEAPFIFRSFSEAPFIFLKSSCPYWTILVSIVLLKQAKYYRISTTNTRQKILHWLNTGSYTFKVFLKGFCSSSLFLISIVDGQTAQKTADLVTFTWEILNEKRTFLCSVSKSAWSVFLVLTW